MTEMVERVAQAIFDVAPFRNNAGNYESQSDEYRRLCRVYAKAAILAMREPTEAMINASNREWDGRMSHRSSGAWKAMIDVALTDAEGDR